MIFTIITLILLLIMSALFSACETIFTSVNIIRLEKYAHSKKKGAKKALKLAKNYDQTLSTILVGNNVVNIVLTAITTAVLTNKFGTEGIYLATIIMTFTILLFGEYIPKSSAKKNPNKLALTFARFLIIFKYILMPITKTLMLFNKGINKVYEVKDDDPSVTEEELIEVVNMSHEEGVIEKEEKKLINAAIKFDDITINNIYTPIEQVFMIDEKMNNEKIKKEIIFNHFSRVPVLKENKIVGILYEKDFLSEYIKDKNLKIDKVMRKPFIVRNNMKIANLLSLMKERKEHLAIVKDTNNRLLGIISLEDTIEYLVGEIEDEHD